MWYIPQVPMDAFEREFDTLLEAAKALSLIIDFSIFEFKNKVKPDYSDIGGICYWDANEEDWIIIEFSDLDWDFEYRYMLGVADIWDDYKNLLELTLG